MMEKKSQLIKYILSDFLTANLSWLIFNIVRYYLLAQYEGFGSITSFLSYNQVIKGQIIIPFGWLILHYYSGYYNKPLEKSRLTEFTTTFGVALLGTIGIFFTLLLKNLPESFRVYYEQFISLFLFSFIFTYIGRYFITSQSTKKIQKREWTIKAIILGNGEKADQIKKELEKLYDSMGYTILGFINIDSISRNSSTVQLSTLGDLENLESIILENKIEELIL
ncbi:sugar transferase, partial [Bacteroidales bacterium OttesenSCG-928-M06]|nr:sugar transferase [Bacteroidales bacterium OttesenSCG-928-M06]